MVKGKFSDIIGSLSLATLFCVFLPSVVSSEVVLDGTMGRSGPLGGPNYSITSDLGQQYGGNLFHSFRSFNINSTESATFSGPNSTQNIISRVTGGSVSNIDGLLRSTIPGADLYFINPAGVIFGEHAQLDVGGSFHVSTADYIRLGDTGKFDASNPPNSVLTVAPPSAFGFLGNSPKDIAVNGSLLEIPEGKTLSLVGGNLSITNGNLYAPSGTINLISVASPGETGFNGLDFTVDAFTAFGTITISDARPYADRPPYNFNPDYHIGNVDVNGFGNGRIFVRGGRLVIDGGELYADTWDAGQSRGIHLEADEGILISNGSYISSESFGSGSGGSIEILSPGPVSITASDVSTQGYSSGDSGSIRVQTSSLTMDNLSWMNANTRGSGRGGSVEINVGTLNLSGGAQINSYSTGTGQGGDIAIRAKDTITISGFQDTDDGLYFSGIHNETYGKGNGGDILIETGSLNITNAGRITATARSGSEGNGGNITIQAKDVITISGFIDIGNGNYSSGIYNETFGMGSAGNVIISTGTLSLSDVGRITATARSGSEGNGGNISITARDTITISGSHDIGDSNFSSGILSETFGKGSAGDVSISTGTLSLTDAGRITVSSREGSEGDGGNITITARDTITISGSHDIGDSNFSSGIFSETDGGGSSGDIHLEAGSLRILNNGRITATARSGSTGNGGNITVRARDSVTISGSHIMDDGIRFSSINNETFGKGNAGNIIIETVNLNLTDGGRIDANARYGSAGNGGNISITTGDTVTISGSVFFGDSNYSSGIFSETFGKGSAGDIHLLTGNLQILDNGRITATAREKSDGNGGNITIQAGDSITISGADIQDNSIRFSGIYNETYGKGNAGNIVIETGNLNLTDGGRIDANARSGSAGNGGNISITARDTITISGFHDLGESNYSSGIYSQTFSNGKAGDILIKTGSMQVTDIGRITATARSGSEGNGGNISITANDTITISGSHYIGDSHYSSGITSETFGKGNAGKILLDADSVVVSDEGRIATTARTNSEGNGGNITMNVGNLTLASGATIDSDTYGTGSGGEIAITAADHIDISEYASISTTGSSTGNAGFIAIAAPSLNLDGGNIASTAYGNGNAGSIALKVRDLTMTNWASISSDIYGTGTGGGIHILASRSASLSDSYITTEGGVDSKGFAGNISIEAPSVTMEYVTISSTAHGDGDAGYIMLDTDDLRMTDFSAITSDTEGQGHGGFIDITARNTVTVTGSSSISTVSYGEGTAGYISFQTPSLEVSGGSSISASAYSSGNGGEVVVDVGRFYLADSDIKSFSYGSGNGGWLRVKATDSVSISGDNAGLFCTSYESGNGGLITVATPSLALDNSATLAANTYGSGNAGNILIAVDSLNVKNGSQINSFSNGAGNGGSVSITANRSVSLSGYSAGEEGSLFHSGIFCTSDGEGSGGYISVQTPSLIMDNFAVIAANTSGSGHGGEISVHADLVKMLNGSQINSFSDGAGDAGIVTIDAKGSVVIAGYIEYGDFIYRSGLFCSSSAEGNAGTINVLTPRLTLDEGRISTRTTGDGKGGNIGINADRLNLLNGSQITSSSLGKGNAGNISIVGTSLEIDNSSIVTSADQAAGGNISLTGETVQLTHQSSISASVASGEGGGGNVTISTTSLVAIEDSDITARADQGYGGNITINAEVVIFSEDSDLNASSNVAGREGTVQVNAPVIDFSANIAVLPERFLSAETLMPKRCSEGEEEMSSFLLKGNDGLPPEPDSFLTSP